MIPETSRISSQTLQLLEYPPAAQGFYMPAEWEPHACSWLCWPFDDDLWDGQLEPVRAAFTQLVATIARFEAVMLNVRDEACEADARTRLEQAGAELAAITFHPTPYNDVWFRDSGPLFVRNKAGQVALTDWRFNAWGEKFPPWDEDDQAPRRVAEHLGMKRFALPVVMEGGGLELNSQGECLTTRSCLRHPKRNPDLSEHDLEALLRGYLGITELVWLERGLDGDHTDGHIDTLARFVTDDTLVCAVTDDPDHVNYEATQENLDTLRRRWGRERVLPLLLPKEPYWFEGRRVPLSYANFYIGNGFVVVSVYDDEHDEQALELLEGLFPKHQVIGLPATALFTGGGAFHCVTQQQPQGEVFHA